MAMVAVGTEQTTAVRAVHADEALVLVPGEVLGTQFLVATLTDGHSVRSDARRLVAVGGISVRFYPQPRTRGS